VTPVRRSSALLVFALVGAGLVVGRLLPELLQRAGHTPPSVSWAAAATLLLAAVLVAGFAWNMWQSLHRKERTIHSEHAVRMLAVAKACVVVSALFTGGYAGFALAFASTFKAPAGHDRVIHGGAASLAALGLLVAALLLERACRLPGAADDESKETGAKPAGA
jgi:uncharacterized membrane protein YidH (DUF202 family)